MPRKGVVVVPPGNQSRRADDGVAGTQTIANRPLVCHVVHALRAAGATDVAIVGGADDLIRVGRSIEVDGEDGSAITYLPRNGRSDLLGVLSTAAPFVGDDACMVHSADGLAAESLEPFAEQLRLDSPDLILLLHRSANKQDRLGPKMREFLGISELNGGRTRLCLSGICLIGPGGLRQACLPVGESTRELDLTDIAERIATGGKHLEVGFLRTWRRYGGSPADLLELNRIVLDQQLESADAFDGHADNRIEGRVVIHPTAEVTSSVILGPSIIGAGTRVTNSYIGPYTSIGAGAEIEGSEIERSIVNDGARIVHVSGRIEASTVGPRANIFRDFNIPRALRLHVGEGVEVALN